MVSIQELLSDPPKAGSQFVLGLDLPDGACGVPSVVPTEGATVREGDPSILTGCFREDCAVKEADEVYGQAALRSRDKRQSELLQELFDPAEESLPSPAEVYYRYWSTANVASVLMVAAVRRTKFDVSNSFLLQLAFPCVLPRGYSKGIFSEKSPKARLIPAYVPLPAEGAFPFVGAAPSQSFRDASLDPAERAHPSSMIKGAIVGMGIKAFSHAVVPFDRLPDDVRKDSEVIAIARSWETLLGPAGSIASDLLLGKPEDRADPNGKGVRIPIMLPLAGPLSLPPGIVGSPAIGVDGIRSLMTEGLRLDAAHLSWLDHPVTRVWLAAAKLYPDDFMLEVRRQSSLVQSIHPKDNYVPGDYDVVYKHEALHDYWKAMEATLAFRLLLDAIMGAGNDEKCKSRRGTANVLAYLREAGNGLFCENNLFGGRPWTLGYEALVLRPPPASKPWDKLFGLAAWQQSADFLPSYLQDYRVQRMDGATSIPHKPIRKDGQSDPAFPGYPKEFPKPIAYEDPFPATDRRWTDPEADTYFEAYERLLMGRLSRNDEAHDVDDLYPIPGIDDGLQEDHEAIERVLQQLRNKTHQFLRRRSQQNKWPGTDSSSNKRSRDDDIETVDPLDFLEKNMTAKKKAQPATPPAKKLQTDESGFKPGYHADDLNDMLINLAGSDGKPSATTEKEKAAGSSTLFPDTLATTKGSAPGHLDNVSALFSSPTASVTNPSITGGTTSVAESLMRDLRRHFPVFTKDLTLIEQSSRSLFADASLVSSTSTSSTSTTVDPAKWHLHDPESRHPAPFTFWSLLLAFREPNFRGTFAKGSRTGQQAPESFRYFPAIISYGVRRDFFTSNEKSLEEYVQSCATRARRDMCWSHRSRHGLLQPGTYFGNITKEILQQFRSGLWTCSSYYDHQRGPSKSNFSVFSLLPSRGEGAGLLLPADGMKYSECMEILRNLYFLLALPVTQGLPTATQHQALCDAIGSSTLLLAALFRYIEKLFGENRSLYHTSLEVFWDDRCDARGKNGLAFFVLSNVDELLSICHMFVRRGSVFLPAMKFLHDEGADNKVYASIDPTIRCEALLQSNLVETASDKTIIAAIAAWEANVHRRIEGLTREAPNSITQAPDTFVDGAGKKKGKTPGQGTPPRRREQKPVKASQPILCWKPGQQGSASALSEVLKAGTLPRFPASRDSRSKEVPLLCFSYTLEGHDGCKRPRCNFAHIDARTETRQGPDAFGSLLRFLELRAVSDKLALTPAGERLANP